MGGYLLLSPYIYTRYSRQIILKEIGLEGQEKLLNAKVLVIGAGGLGSPVLLYLAAAGVGNIGVADNDVVDISNLHRQIMYTTEDLNKRKVDIVKHKLKKINPGVIVQGYAEKVNEDNIGRIAACYDVVIDATDNMPSRYLINDYCYINRIPLVEGAVQGFIGMLTTIVHGKTPCYRCIYPISGKKQYTGEGKPGVAGMTPGVIGSLQALEALKIILGIDGCLLGRVLLFNGLNLSFSEINIEKNKNCKTCSGPA
jgi:molybdopterin/thiamine biosynthesis adenylyltransferase